ncbi:MAG: prepilin-type N-terminal cleavage/methylation domain-containing protein, partial [Hydrogenovibrio sp.]|uniref:type II secretion system protein n=1 Tax=Hydrogenovibrio sp. TaxID=2065821 RepID=UPI0028708230
MQMQFMINKKGFTLVEMAVTLVVLGIVMVLAFKLVPKYTEQTSKKTSQSQYERIDRAIEGFVFANQRLPSPAQAIDGVETPGLEKGYLPYKTLGLSAAPRNEVGLPLRFAVFDQPNVSDRQNDRSLTVLTDRFMPYVATDENSVDIQPVATEPGTLLNPGSSNILDFCQALNTATEQAQEAWATNGNAHWVFSPSDLRIVSEAGSNRYNVAYVIHDLGQGDSGGSGNLSDGQNTTTTNDLAFSDPATSLDRLN